MKQVVVMAGGKGLRLRPFTELFPKPLIPFQNRPVLSYLLDQLKSEGFEDVIISVGYLSEYIKMYFGNGEKIGLNIRYVDETQPLGTAGSLSIIDNLDENFLVTNGDILTDISFRKFFEFHLSQGGELTVATAKRDYTIPLGYLNIDEDYNVSEYIEKPKTTLDVSMGIYAISKSIMMEKIFSGEFLDMPTLVNYLVSKNKRVKAFKHSSYWLDIGRYEEYEKALSDFNEYYETIRSSRG